MIFLAVVEHARQITAGAVPWFPQEQRDTFYLLKGVFGLVSTVMLVIHMARVWEIIKIKGGKAQMWRYIALLAMAVVLTGGSLEQIKDASLVSYRNLGGFICSVILLIAMVYSLIDEQVKRQAHNEMVARQRRETETEERDRNAAS